MDIPTSTIHDAFFTNASKMLEARNALRGIYASILDRNSIELTLKEMKKRGLPKDLYDAYYKEAVEKGLIPVPGKSKVGGKTLNEEDILKAQDILEEIPDGFFSDRGWYGVG